MKPVHVTLDEPLLRRLDADPEARRDGRSAVVRRAIVEYLRHSRARRIASDYRRAYRVAPGLGAELEGWEDQGMWPVT